MGTTPQPSTLPRGQVGTTPQPRAGQTRVVGTVLQPPPPAEAPALDVRDNAIQLSLDQAIEIALQRNLGIVVQRYLRMQSLLGVTQSLGLYDLRSSASLSAFSQTGPVIDPTTPSQTGRSQSLGFSLTQRLPTGGDVSVGVENTFVPRSGTNDASYGTGLTFGLIQPLLGGYGPLINERSILVARINSQVGREEFRLQVTTVTQQVINAYWNLVNAREQLVVAQQSLQLARDLNDRNRIQVQVGTMAPLEMTQSEAAIATREGEIIQATSAVGDAEDELRRLLNLPAGPLWQTTIKPTTDPVTTERPSINIEESIRAAVADRPELHTQDLQLELARRDAEYFRKLTQPSLGLNIQYGYNGTGLAYNDAFSQVTGFDFRTWRASLQFAYPIQNRAARAQSAIANLDVDRFQTLFDQQQRVIETEVRRAARAVDTALKAIEAARIAREFQEKNLDAEKKRYENGMSTSFQITQIQDQLTQARSNEVTATVNYRNVLAEYYRSIGRLLDHESVVVEDAQDPDYASQRFSFRRGILPGEGR